MAAELADLMNELTGEKVKDLHVYNTVAKLASERVKCLRFAGESAARREDAEIQRARDKRDRERRRGGRH